MLGLRWMDLESVIINWNSLKNSAYDITSEQDGMIQEGAFKKGWIPFAEDYGGSFLVMDLEPGDKGTYGQIITIDHDSSISYVISESIQEFFKLIVESFKNEKLNIWLDEEVRIIDWKHGHLFDDVITLKGSIIEKNSIPVSGFWAEYFKEDVIDGNISTEVLAKKKMVVIKAEMSKSFGEISLYILKHMINLKELIIHEDKVSNFEPIKDMQSLRKLIIKSKLFKESDLKYIVNLKQLKELSLVEITVKDISVLQNIKTLKCLRLYKISTLDSSCIRFLRSLNELSIENIECDDLTCLSFLDKLTKLELKDINIPNLNFLKSLKKLTIFITDRKAIDESEITLFSDMQNLKELIYPIGDMKLIKKCGRLREIGVDASRLQSLELLEGLNITNITIFNAISEKDAESVVTKFEKYCNLRSYGWQRTWK